MREDDGQVNTIDEEHCLRSSTFLLIITACRPLSQFVFFMICIVKLVETNLNTVLDNTVRSIEQCIWFSR